MFIKVRRLLFNLAGVCGGVMVGWMVAQHAPNVSSSTALEDNIPTITYWNYNWDRRDFFDNKLNRYL